MSRSARQALQLGLVALVAVLLVGAYLLSRGNGTATDPVARPGESTSATPTPGSTGRTDPRSGLPWVDETALPVQARQTLALMRKGGPYPYPRSDDQLFGNREGLLPAQASGYYREYTVETPGAVDRGARRIIAGRGGEIYYTDDHYASFRRVREGR
ncbi:MAG: ribonuclease domain-containing protein [Dermatophilaceae bacterium]